jgi:hypothetical protein
MARLQLQEEVALNLVQMVKQPPTARRKIARWITQSCNELGPSSTVEDTVGSASASVGADTARPEDTVEYERSTLTEIRPGVFYVPKLSNQVVFYPFILADDIHSYFQVPNHNRNRGFA